MQIKELFDKISKKENHVFEIDEMYYPKTKFEIKTEQGYKPVVGMILKKDVIVEIETEHGVVNVSQKHKIRTKTSFLEVSHLSIGDYLFNANIETKTSKIINISINKEDLVYDISVDSDEHEWTDSQGYVHHNTFGIKHKLQEMLGPYREGPEGKWAFYEGMKGSGFGYYQTFLMNKDKLVVVDDSDSIWHKQNINFMKIITSDSGDRAPTWAGPSTVNVGLMSQEEREIYEMQYLDAVMEDPNTTMKPPSKFNFTGSFINISNMKGSEFDPAIKSRSIFIDVYLAQRDVIRRMATIMGFEGSDDKEIAEVLEAIDPNAKDALTGTGRYSETPNYMTPEEARKNKQMNMRSVGIVRALRQSGFPGWQRAGALYS